ncbi:MAG: flagellar protein FlgN [Spirochaetota bacterium]
MPLSASKLETILKKQMNIYIEILVYEEQKSEAIISKNGKAIQEIASLQEKLIKSVEILESERINLIQLHFTGNKSASNAETITLRELTASMAQQKRLSITRLGEELKSLLLKVRAKQESNFSMLKDNMEYFDILISGLKNSSSVKSGYGKDGKEDERVMNPVLFSQKA